MLLLLEIDNAGSLNIEYAIREKIKTRLLNFCNGKFLLLLLISLPESNEVKVLIIDQKLTSLQSKSI